MNLIAVDIGNTNIAVGLFLKGIEQSIKTVSGDDKEQLVKIFKETWEKIPVSKRSKEGKRDGVIAASSVKPAWTQLIQETAKKEFGEKVLMVGKEIPFPMDLSVDKTYHGIIGTDRVLAAAAAYAVVEDAVIVTQVGTAVTIDLVDDRGIFLGGVIVPGIAASANALKDSTAQLPKVEIHKPETVYGKNTIDAINCGIYYSVVATIQEIIRRYAELIGKWPQTILTGTGAALIKDDCDFIDSYVPNLVVKGVALAYRKYIDTKE
jgi:type III pantothenate kinase